MKKVQLITDGACLGNPGPGGWAAVLRFNEMKKEIWNSEKHTTNNRMELTAAIEGLKSLREQCEVEVVTDSEYVKNGITTWIHGWKRKGWMTAAKKPVVNQDLWQALDEQVNRHKTTWTWTKGHANHTDNNRCDELATRAAREQSSSSEVFPVGRSIMTSHDSHACPPVASSSASSPVARWWAPLRPGIELRHCQPQGCAECDGL